jgi:hypothetical protein
MKEVFDFHFYIFYSAYHRDFGPEVGLPHTLLFLYVYLLRSIYIGCGRITHSLLKICRNVYIIESLRSA